MFYKYYFDVKYEGFVSKYKQKKENKRIHNKTTKTKETAQKKGSSV